MRYLDGPVHAFRPTRREDDVLWVEGTYQGCNLGACIFARGLRPVGVQIGQSGRRVKWHHLSM